MALSSSVLAALIKSKIEALGVTAGVENDPDLTYQALAEAIVEHITNDAIVNTGIPVATTGNASAQTGATTATGTIS